MSLDADHRVSVYTDLSAGDEIEAGFGGQLRHRGPVTELAPGTGMFWIMDHVGGARKILNLEDFHVVRVLAQRPSQARRGWEPTAG